MRKQALILVDIDTDRPGHSFSGPFNDPRMSNVKCFGINVSADQEAEGIAKGSKEEVLSTTLHELGHVIGAIFEMPGNANDPRKGPVSNEVYGLIATPALLDSENEAWDVAQRIFNANRSFAMNTYGKALDASKVDPFSILMTKAMEDPNVRAALKKADDAINEKKAKRFHRNNNVPGDLL